MFNKKRIVVAVVFILFMFCFITFAGGTPQNQAIATRNVTFIDSYNNSEISAQRVVVGEDAEVPENPRHDRLVFAGWYLDSDRDTRITNFTNITDNITVVALYGADINGNGVIDEDDATYTVTFRDSVTDTVIATREVLVGMNAVPPTAPIHAGLTFTGWDASYSNVRRDTTVNAVYRTTPVVDVNRYTVTFRDGLDNSVVATVEVEEGLTATAPAAPAHEGYVFVRWDGDLDNITEDSEITGIYAVDSNGNGEADETEERYTVSYKSLIEGTKNEAPKHENSFLTNERYTVLENTFALDKAVFIGWTTDEDSAKEIVVSKEEERKISLIKAGSTATIGNENVIYYAVWAKNVNASTGDTTPDYDEAQYDLNIVDGDNTTTTKHVEGETVALPEGTDKSETVKFYGWSTTNHGTLTKEDKGTKVVTLDEVTFAKADITVYAVYAKYNETTGKYEFEDEQYTVTYESALEATGTTVDAEKYVLGEEYTIADNNFTKDESLFLGWTTSEDIAKVLVETEEQRESAGTLVAEGSTATIDGNVTYYAVWAANRDGDDTPDYEETHYGVTYESTLTATGSTEDDKTYVAGEEFTVKSNGFEKDKALFLGWTTDANVANVLVETKEQKTEVGTLVQPADKASMLEGGVVYYAVWAADRDGNGTIDADEKITVNYEVDAIGNASLSKTSESLMPGTKITFPTVTLDDGYEYAWYEGNTKVTSATVKAGETTRTFTAKVTLIDYTVTFDYANDRDTNVTKNDYHYGDTIVIPSNPGDYRDESKLYVFKGWFIDGKAMTEKDKTVTGNKTFTARYDEYELPNLIATPSTTAWTKDDVTVKLTSNKEVKKYYVRVNGGEWKEFTPSKNGYTATTKCVVEFKILDKDGLESLPTKPIEIKIDKTSPVIVSPANKATINANGEPEVNLNIKIKETESGLVKNSDGQMIVYYLPKKIDSVSSFKKELEKAEGKPYLVVDKNGNATLDVIIDGDYTFYAVDAAGNEVANVTTVSITGIKESGITDEGEKNVPKTAVTLHIGKTVYGHDGLIIKNSPSRSVTITANEGYEVETIRWSVGRKNKKYFQDGNGTPGSLDTSILLENKDTSGGSVYTIYTKSKNTETGEIVEDIEYIYAYSKFWFLWYHNY